MPRVMDPSRVLALAFGVRHYLPTKPCPMGHMGKRLTAEASCIECRNYRKKQKRLDNPKPREYASKEVQLAGRIRRSREWYLKNKDRTCQRAAQRYADPEYAAQKRAAARRFARENPLTVRAYNNLRRARKRNADGLYTATDVEVLVKEQSGKCAGCFSAFCGNMSVDHSTPLIRGGSNWPENLQLLCTTCNSSKRSLTNAEWFRKIPALRRLGYAV